MRKEVQEKIADLLCKTKNQTLTQSGRQTDKQFLDQWLLSRADNISDRTQDNYRRSIDKQIGPRIGGYQLTKLSPQAVQMMYTAMRADGVGKDTIKLSHVVLHAALEQAVKLNLVTINVADRVEVPAD